MGIFDRAKDTATTRPDSPNQGTIVDSAGQPANPDDTGTPVGTGVADGPEEGVVEAGRDQFPDADA
jgi:hypothetical protein